MPSRLDTIVDDPDGDDPAAAYELPKIFDGAGAKIYLKRHPRQLRDEKTVESILDNLKVRENFYKFRIQKMKKHNCTN